VRKKFLFDVEGFRESPKSSKYSKEKPFSIIDRGLSEADSDNPPEINSSKLRSIQVEEGEEHGNAERVHGTRKLYDPATA
jgi:hypothetical protein